MLNAQSHVHSLFTSTNAVDVQSFFGQVNRNLWRYAFENLILNTFPVILIWDPSLIPAIVNNMISAVQRFHGNSDTMIACS